ncbi:MAG: carboxypeptidase-like regulatory domain-containing protein [Planctomycetota bacterium]
MWKREHLPLLVLILLLATGLASLGWFAGARSNDAPVPEQPAPAGADSKRQIESSAGRRGLTSAGRDAGLGRRAFEARDARPDETRFSGRLLDARSGSAVVGAVLRLVDGEREAHATSAEDGSFTLTWPAGTPAALEIAHPGYVDQRRPRVELAPGLEIVLVPSGSIEGRVLSGRGVDLAAGEVGLWVHNGLRALGDVLQETSIDAAGRFGFGDLAPGLYTAGLHVRGGPLLLESGFAVSAGLATELVLDLGQGLTLRGRVLVRGSLEPLAGAVIEARPELQGASDGFEERGWTRLLSAGDGTFEVRGLPSGRVNVSVRAPWGSVQERQFAVSETGEGRLETFVLPAPAFLSGVVVDAAGQPVPGARVTLAPEGDVRSFQWAHIGELREELEARGLPLVRADGRGRFDLGAVPALTRLQLAAYPAQAASGAESGAERGTIAGAAAGFQRGVRLREGEARTGLVLELVRALALEGRVVDEAQQGIAGATVELRTRAGRAWPVLGQAHTGADGRFRFSAVPEGGVRLVAQADGFQDGAANLTFPRAPGSSARGEPIQLELAPASVIAGTVLDPGGWAVPGASVRARKHVGDIELRKAPWQAADEFGRFRITGLEEGLWTVDAWAPTHRLVEGSAATVRLPSAALVLLTLEPRPTPEPATITGELALRGSGLPLAGLRLQGARGASVTLEGTRFRITGVRPGRLRLTAKAPGVETVVYDALQPAPGARIDLGRYEVRRTSAVSVRVQRPGGQPVLGATVRLQRAAARIAADQAASALAGVRSPSAKVRLRYDQEHQAYEHAGVSRGTWELRVSHSGWSTVKREVTLAKGSEVLTVELTPKGKDR